MMLKKYLIVFFLSLSMLGTLSVQIPFATASLFGGGEEESAEDDATPEGQVVQPAIPIPDFLPAPDVGERGYDTQNYILNVSIPRAINIIIGLLGIATFIGMLMAAIQMLTAYGNEDKINRAKTNLRYGVLGFLTAILAYGIVSIVVSISLPNEQDGDSQTSLFGIPSAHAVDVEDDIDILLPSQQDFIEVHDEDQRVSLPGGNFLSEIVPAIITNAMYATSFLIFIGFMYGGVLMVISRGNEEGAEKAKSIMTYSAVALGVMALGFAIIFGIANLNLTDDEDSDNDEVFVNTQERNDNN